MANYTFDTGASGSYWEANSSGWLADNARQGTSNADSSYRKYVGILAFSSTVRNNILNTYASYYPTSASLTVTRVGIGSHGSERILRFGVGTGVYGSYLNDPTHYSDGTINAGTGSSTTFSIPTSWIDYYCTTGSSCFIIGNREIWNTVSRYVGVNKNAVLTINWATRNTAPYWGSGAGVSVSGTINGGYVQAGTTMTISWPAAQDAQSNITRYYYSVSTNGGSSYGSETNNGTTRNFTYSNSIQGAQLRFRVRAYDSGGLYSGYLTSGTTIVNYGPGAPPINSINGTSPSQNMIIPYNASMVLGASGHSGGFASGWSALQYRQTGTYTGAYGTDLTKALTGLSNNVGSTASISAQVSDGWATATSTVYTVRVGASLAAPSLTLSKAYLDSTTNITIGSCLIDGAYYSSVTEGLRIQCNINGAGWVDLWTGNRTYSSRTTANNVTVTNLFQRLFNLNSGFVGADATIQFRGYASTGHLDSPVGGTITVTYVSAKFITSPASTTSITHADDSTTFKYPMDNQIPVTEASFTVSFGSTKDANFLDTITATLYSRVGSGAWTARGTRSITVTSYSSTFVINFADISVTRGQTISLKIELTSIANGSTIVHASIEPSWNDGGATKSIEFRSFPSFTAAITAQQPSFIRNGFSNNAAATVQLTTDVNKAYYIVSSINIEGRYSGADPIILSIYDIVNSTHTYNAQTILSDTISSEDKSWIISSTKILGDAWEVTSATLLSNTDVTITYTFTIREAYRSSRTGNSPMPWESGFSSRAASTTNITQLTNTFCQPQFTSGSISFIRA